MDIPAEAFFEDERDEHLPEQYIDQEETKRLIREIIEELPEDQRAAIGMYYYEEMSVKDISAAMGATENAVKSRLLYGRRKIEKKVRELEKKGTKLYGIAPIPFLLLLFRSQKEYALESPCVSVLQAILGRTAVQEPTLADGSRKTSNTVRSYGTKPAGAAKTAGTAAAGTSTAKIALAAVAAVTIIGGGVFGISRIANTDNPKGNEDTAILAETPAVQESTPDWTAGTALVDDPVVQMPAQALAPANIETPEPELTEVPEADSDNPVEAAYEQYRVILSQAESYDFGSEAFPDGTFRYALEYMEENDPVPTLLLCQNGEDHIDHVRIFYYDVTGGAVLAPEEILMMGVAQTGGYRGALSMMGDGNGIQVSEVDSMRGDIYISRAMLAEDHLTVTLEWSGFMDDDDPYRANAREITWYDLSDLTGFEKTGAPDQSGTLDRETNEPMDSTDAMEEAQDEQSTWVESEQEAGRIVLTGTIDTYSYDEAVELQGIQDWNGPDSRPYRIIVLDEPQIVRGKSVDGYQESTVRLILADDAEIPVSYDGQSITFSIDPETLWWPSDTRIPVGQPATNDVHVMDQ